jgi:Holliday junction DNA helicase RuvA
MITSLTGILTSKSPTEICIDVQGVGYSVSIPLSTYERLGEAGSPISILTHFHVREDAMQLFGFATEKERQLFRLLISVSGIGPKIAQGILSRIQVDELQVHITGGHINELTTIPGIGKKTAERLVLELRDKVAKSMPSTGTLAVPESSSIRNEALQALTSLGYSPQVAEKTIRQVLIESGTAAISVEELIKRALRYAGR